MNVDDILSSAIEEWHEGMDVDEFMMIVDEHARGVLKEKDRRILMSQAKEFHTVMNERADGF